jgi:hypothetical protein
LPRAPRCQSSSHHFSLWRSQTGENPSSRRSSSLPQSSPNCTCVWRRPRRIRPRDRSARPLPTHVPRHPAILVVRPHALKPVSVTSSPEWQLGARTMRSFTADRSGGRPGCLCGSVHRRASAARCHLRTVSGRTSRFSHCYSGGAGPAPPGRPDPVSGTSVARPDGRSTVSSWRSTSSSISFALWGRARATSSSRRRRRI